MNMKKSSSSSVTTQLRCGNDIIGHLESARISNGTVSGVLSSGPDFPKYQAFFERAQAAAKHVDDCSAEEYQSAWEFWRESNQLIESLGLAYGEPAVSIEGFAIDGQGVVEFDVSLALWAERVLRGDA